MQQLDDAGMYELLTAVVRQARRDAQRLDVDAILFLRSIGAKGYAPHKVTFMRMGEALQRLDAIYQQRRVNE